MKSDNLRFDILKERQSALVQRPAVVLIVKEEQFHLVARWSCSFRCFDFNIAFTVTPLQPFAFFPLRSFQFFHLLRILQPFIFHRLEQ